MAISLEELGLSQEEIVDRVISAAARKLLHGFLPEEREDGKPDLEPLAKRLKDYIRDAIEEKYNEIYEEHIKPGIGQLIDKLTLEETNRWGEKKGEALTFKQYLVQRAEHYMKEEVDYQGNTRNQKGSCYSWKKEGTRIAHMVHKHLHYRIASAMKEALKKANSTIVEGLEKAVKIKLASIAQALEVHVKTK